MSRDVLIEAMALALFNRMRRRRKMRPVDHIGANDTTECNECRAEATAALDALRTARPDIADVLDGKAAVVPMEATLGQLEAGQIAWLRDSLRLSSTLYAAMIAASPYRSAG